MTVFYQYYLNSFGETKLDSISRMVARNTEQVLQLFDKNASADDSKSELYVALMYHQKYIARIVEGCNAVSVIILFISFVLK